MAGRVNRPLPNRVRAAREQAGKRLIDVAEATGVNKDVLSRVERGNQELEDAFKVKVAAYLGSTVQALFFPDDVIATVK